MPTDYNEIKPTWAWAVYEPTAARPWSRTLAAHLFRRAGFGARSAELDAAVKAGPRETLSRLCTPAVGPPEFESTSALLAGRTASGGNPQELAAWWLYRMLNTPDPLLEKLTLFWHGHFATSVAKVGKPRLMLDQNELLRSHARGKFEAMVGAVSRDPAMLIYLDSTTNRRIHPNENYARELMELFALGVGNYTEQDIKEVARAFTGWEVLADRFRFDKSQHDTGTKSFLGSTGNFDGDDAVRIVLANPASPKFIARRLVRFFVFDEPSAPDALIEPLADDLRDNGFEIGPVVRRILASNLFFSDYAVGRKVRSPIDLAVGLLRTLGASTNLVRLAQGTAELGQSLFQPPNVKGWDGGRLWINSSTLLARANLVRSIVSASETRYTGGTLSDLADAAGASSPEKTVDWLLELLVAVPVPVDARAAILDVLRTQSDRVTGIAHAVHVASALPEFQLA